MYRGFVVPSQYTRTVSSAGIGIGESAAKMMCDENEPAGPSGMKGFPSNPPGSTHALYQIEHIHAYTRAHTRTQAHHEREEFFIVCQM